AFGPQTPLFDWYLRLPMNHTFRGPVRLFWMTGVCLSVLTALGTEVLLRPEPSSRRGTEWLPLLAVLLATVALHFLSPLGLRPLEWLLIALLIAVTIATRIRPAPALTSGVVVGAVLVNLFAFPISRLPIVLRSWAARAAIFRAAPPDPTSFTARAA